jgi:hypothetical protein
MKQQQQMPSLSSSSRLVLVLVLGLLSVFLMTQAVPMVEAFTTPQRHHRSITAAAASVPPSSSTTKSIRKTFTSLSVVYLTADRDSSSSKSNTSTTTSTTTTTTTINEVPIFDFTTTTNSETTSSKSDVLKFDRIDDAIMGGISTSQLRQVVIVKDDGNDDNVDDGAGNNYASWSGVCRLDGGGFCGTRTLPFKDGRPLNVQNQNGFYVKLRLDSDNEPERRVWKMTTRTQNIQTSEQVYQSSFVIPKRVEKEETEKENATTVVESDELESSAAMMDLTSLIIPNSNKKQKLNAAATDATADDEESKEDEDEYWKTIYVPFSSFIQVRGPRIVENGPPLDVSNGIYQIGLSLSKFQIQKNVTQLDNFRDGYFNLHLKEIGVYNTNNANNDEQKDAAHDNGTKTTATATTGAANLLTTQTLTKEEAKNKRPLLLKILSPIATLFFNEKR